MNVPRKSRAFDDEKTARVSVESLDSLQCRSWGNLAVLRSRLWQWIQAAWSERFRWGAKDLEQTEDAGAAEGGFAAAVVVVVAVVVGVADGVVGFAVSGLEEPAEAEPNQRKMKKH